MSNPMFPWETTPDATINSEQANEEKVTNNVIYPWDFDDNTSTTPESATTEAVTEEKAVSTEESVRITEVEEPAETVQEVIEGESMTAKAQHKAEIVAIHDDPKISKTVKSLSSLPASDGNFLSALNSATKEELEETLKILEAGTKNATRIAKVQARLKKITKSDTNEPDVAKEIKAEDVTDVTEDTKETTEAEDTTAENTTTETEEEVVEEPVVLEDEFTKINSQEISDKEKAILYMVNHYHINPNLLKNLLDGDFEDAWKDISELNKENLTVKQKLEKELNGADDSRLKIVEFLINKATKEPSFANQILLEHKEFDRCYKYISDKVRETFSSSKNTSCIQVDDNTVYNWAVEYYNLDDYEAVMKERKAAEEKKKKAAEKAAKKAKTTKTKAKTTTKVSEPKDASKDETKVEPKTETKDESSAIAKPVVPIVENEVKADSSKDLKPDTPIDIEETSKITEDDIKVITEASKAIEEKKEEESKENESIAIADSYGQFQFTF